MMKLGRKIGKQLLSGILTFSMVLSSAITTHAYTEDTQILDTVSISSSDCVLIGIKGDYITQAKEALDRINEIRREACEEGVIDPRDKTKTRKLTEDDYVPLKWSAELERIARIRAAEASVMLGHNRPSGGDCWTISATGVSNSGEVLAWNWSLSMMNGITQWYNEKAAWVAQDSSKETGHYTIMINPQNTYVGLGCMITDYYIYPNTLCGRFSSTSSALDTTMKEAITDCIQLIEVKKSFLTEAALTKVSSNSVSNLKVGDTVSYELVIETNMDNRKSTALLMDNVKWTSSNTKVATVDSYGEVTGVGAGTATITATSDSGFTASDSITFTGSHDNTNTGNANADNNSGTNTGDNASNDNNANTGTNNNKSASDKENTTGKEVKPPSVSKVKSLKARAGSKKLTITWKKVSGVAGYELQVSTKSNFKGAKTIKIGKAKKQYVAKKLKAKKKYYVRIRAYKTYKDEKGKTKKTYGGWVKVSKKTK